MPMDKEESEGQKPQNFKTKLQRCHSWRASKKDRYISLQLVLFYCLKNTNELFA